MPRERDELKRKARNEDIIAMRRAGFTTARIRKLCNVGYETIYDVFREYNAKVPENKRIPISRMEEYKFRQAKHLREMIALLDLNLPYEETREKLLEFRKKSNITAASYRKLRLLLEHNGRKIPKLTPIGKIDRGVAKRMRDAGASVTMIARRFNISVPRVVVVLNAANDKEAQKEQHRLSKRRYLARKKRKRQMQLQNNQSNIAPIPWGFGYTKPKTPKQQSDLKRLDRE